METKPDPLFLICTELGAQENCQCCFTTSLLAPDWRQLLCPFLECLASDTRCGFDSISIEASCCWSPMAVLGALCENFILFGEPSAVGPPIPCLVPAISLGSLAAIYIPIRSPKLRPARCRQRRCQVRDSVWGGLSLRLERNTLVYVRGRCAAAGTFQVGQKAKGPGHLCL